MKSVLQAENEFLIFLYNVLGAGVRDSASMQDDQRSAVHLTVKQLHLACFTSLTQLRVIIYSASGRSLGPGGRLCLHSDELTFKY